MMYGKCNIDNQVILSILIANAITFSETMLMGCRGFNSDVD